MAYRKNSYFRRKRIQYGKKFRTRKGRYGRYKYVNGRKVSFVKHTPYRNRSRNRRRRY